MSISEDDIHDEAINPPAPTYQQDAFSTHYELETWKRQNQSGSFEKFDIDNILGCLGYMARGRDKWSLCMTTRVPIAQLTRDFPLAFIPLFTENDGLCGFKFGQKLTILEYIQPLEWEILTLAERWKAMGPILFWNWDKQYIVSDEDITSARKCKAATKDLFRQ